MVQLNCGQYKNSSLWTKFDPLSTNIFCIYNFSSLDIIKFVAYRKYHCLKSIHIRSYPGPHFPAFGLNTKRHGVRSISPYSVRMWKNVDQNNSDYGHISRREYQCDLRSTKSLIFSKNSILPQKFEIFFKIWVVDVGYLWFNLFLFCHSDLDIRHCFLVLFCDKFISSITFCTWWKFNCSSSLS